ncbi:Fpg/Nei family DNA glycosylase [Cryobacterium sp. TMT1-21]|uniref:DNA-(apurinic or apyrimidinic site) lyase n=1 Tax=Cryobacterium shii TaxID=1259235 RepID=A0AAQ2C7L4_9MICO|nr:MULTISPECIES: DNA-formamidopyrimidine glycosylase family protein [Cryobacterium]TFC49837.1 Fpg/Nei family DNA glycosylase [Cryobacterium shii]TFC86011.1 Fpg/Nei family DNA glycosylase [Cryobacterium sp. TmT2-59]TFD13752.1 Fpg/Nei family DNA glycosylase [Cryobacterium sp. TMT4-10]TFD16741.1 Fpg/Nei family DNA glycosylase [Cryobacterium sp. TMT1-21]TFD19732.1 Fpg/Nei family DNA glycosylase [Cryobacterium sp. TMT2-23]
MPEGHSVHRIARQFARNFVGKRIRLSSPQGRFVDGAARLDGHSMTDARAVGKQMFLEFDNGLWLRVHLGLYGAWDFAGDIQVDATVASANGRMGQTGMRGTGDAVLDSAGENSVRSIGAPRLTRLRMAEAEKVSVEPDGFPPDPIGQVRVRLLADDVVADLRGPTACEVLGPDQVEVAMNRLGPDPMLDDGAAAEERFVSAVRKKPTPIGRLLMDQSVVSGIGNVYRAELLFRAGINPYAPGKSLRDEQARALWRDWAHLLKIGVSTGQMMTMDDLGDEDYVLAMRNRADRHWVYKREGLPCRICGTHITLEEMAARKLYWCPRCQS